MYQSGFKMKENSKTTTPKRCIFFDTESIDTGNDSIFEKHKAYYLFGIFIDIRLKKRKEVNFESNDCTEFWEWIVSKTTKKDVLYLFAHNAKFDILTSDGVNILNNMNFILESYWENGMATMFSFKNIEDDKKILVINTANYVPLSLKTLGKSVNLEKLDFDFEIVSNFCKVIDGKIVLNKTHSDYDVMRSYCQRDVEIVKEFVLSFISFIKLEDLGKFCVTSASQAMHSYRHRFMKDIYFHKDNDIKKIERLSYKGGRVSLFKRGMFKENVYYLDINSMYPFIMKNFKIPFKLVGQEYNISEGRFKDLTQKYFTIAEVTGTINKPAISMRIDGKLCYPVGDFKQYLTSPEIELVFKYGNVKEFNHVVYYEHDYIFTDYVNFFYSKRLQYKEEGNEVFVLLCKLFLNSLYGKFAQMAHLNERVGTCHINEISTTEIFDVHNDNILIERRFGGNVFYETKSKEHDNNFIAISAAITAIGRCLIWEIIEEAGLENCYYCDTDSVFVNEDGYNRISHRVDNNNLGMLKLEGMSNNYKVIAPKQYIFKDIKKVKGLNKLSVQKNNNGLYDIKTFLGFNSHVKLGDISKYHIRKHEKYITGIYSHGYHMKDNNIIPLTSYIKENQTKILEQEIDCFNLEAVKDIWYNKKEVANL